MKKKKSKHRLPKNQSKQYQQTKKQVKKNRYADLLGLAIIILLGVIIYSNSFSCSFHLDDRTSIYENMDIRDLSDVKTIWNISPTRFISYYTFAINYHFGELNVWGYHLFNLVIHLINACLVYWLTLLLFSCPAIKDKPVIKHKKALALFTALLFISHPLATQSVTYIVQRMTSMAALFYLLSLTFYLRARLSGKGNKSMYLLIAGSVISGVLAMLTKENAFTLPFAIVLLEIFFLQTKRLSLNFKDYRVILPIAGLLGFILIVLFKFSFDIFEPHPPIYQNDFRTISSLNYLLTQFSVIVKYIQLLFLPFNQNWDYDYAISNNFFEIRTIISFLFLLSLIILAIFLFKKNRIISFGIFWFFLTLSIESSIIPIDDLIFEHRTYLPSFGFFLILSSGIYVLLWNKYKNIAFAILVLVIGVNSYLTYERNKVWKDDITLWSDVISKSPNKARPYNSLGYYLMTVGRYNEALSNFNKGIELQPIHAEAYVNRGLDFFYMQMNDQAIADFNKAIELQPVNAVNAKAYYARGSVFEVKKQLKLAYNDYLKAIELDPNYPEAYNNRGNIFKSEKKFDKALEDYTKAIELNPNYPEAYSNRAAVYLELKKYREAINDLNKAIELKPDLAEAYANRGVAALNLGNKVDCCRDFRKAIELGLKQVEEEYNKYCR